MIIHFNDKLNQTIDIQVDDDSYRLRQIMGDHNLTINFSLPEYVEIPIGAHCVYEGQVYTLCKSGNYQKSGDRRYKYTLIFESEEVKSRKWMFRNINDGKLKFLLTGKPIDFLEMFVANLNMRDPGWTVGRCIAGNEKSMSFSHELCDAVGKRIADEYQTELEYEGKVVSLGKVEYNKANPLPLAYGNGKGFIPGTKRESENVYPIGTLYVQGDTRNINYSVYAPDGTTHSDTLLLPLSQRICYDGKYFYNYNAATQKWSVFDENNNTWGECAEPANVREYLTAADGQSLRRGDKETTDFESSVNCTDIYPSRVGTITEVIPINDKDSEGEPFVYYDFVDDTIPENLNYNECSITGGEMTIIPQSGMLVGREFGVSYDHDKRRFAIAPSELDGCMMPGDVYIPRKGNKYAVFGIQLPNAYLCDDITKTGASWDMFRYAVKYMFDNEEQNVTYTGELDGIYARENWADLAGKIVLGGYVRLDDPELKEGLLVRITSIKEFINKQHKPKIELSNTTSSAGFMQRIGKIEAEEVVAENNKKEVKAFTKRQFRDVKESMTMLEKAFDYYSASIQPVTIQTMQLLAGDESLQFLFVKNSGTDVDRAFSVIFDEDKKTLNVSGGLPSGFCRLMHKTIGIKSLSSSHAESEHKFWLLEPFVSEYLGDENQDKAYYLYAKCRKNGETSLTDYDGFILRETPIAFETDDDFYHMLVGILNSEYGGTRSFSLMNRYTAISPGQVLTDRIVTAEGDSFIDLLNNTLHLGDDRSYLDWNNILKDTLSTINMMLESATIKTKLSVLGEALIAGFLFSDEVIKSTMKYGSNPAMYLNGKTGKLHLQSNTTGGDWSLDRGQSTIDIDASTGEVCARNDNGAAYLSASGIFCNNAKTDAMPASSGYTHYSSIVGLGFGNVDNRWEFDKESTLIAGVYGRADNTGTAPAYGGYFQDLYAAGLILGPKYIGDYSSYHLYDQYTQCLGLTNSGKTATVYLPTGALEGRVIFAKQIGQGQMRFRARTGQHIFDDVTANTYYDVTQGWEAKFTFAKFILNGVEMEAWFVGRWKF